MRRPALITLTALGGLVCVLGGTGLFAALSDTARSGTNSVESAPLAASADIQVARATGPTDEGLSCGEFSENLTTGFFTVENALPNDSSSEHPYCIRNVGSQLVNLSVMIDELVDVDLACTGDEELHGDTSCGNDGVGELADRLTIYYRQYEDCGGVTTPAPVQANLAANSLTPVSLGALGPNGIACFGVSSAWPFGTGPEHQRAQSDRVTWRFKWTAQA